MRTTKVGGRGSWDGAQQADVKAVMAERVRGVNIAGAGSTIGSERERARKGGASLIELYDQWRRQEKTKKVRASGADREDIEGRAMRKGRKRTAKLLASGRSAPQALRGGHRRYVEHGGNLDFAHWCDQV